MVFKVQMCADITFLYTRQQMNTKLIKTGFIAAGLMNIGSVLLFSRAFTNEAINNADPVVMSNFGLVVIAVWGLAYFGAAAINANIKWLAGAFALEKLVYVVVWVTWLSKTACPSCMQKTFLRARFLAFMASMISCFCCFCVGVFAAKTEALSRRMSLPNWANQTSLMYIIEVAANEAPNNRVLVD